MLLTSGRGAGHEGLERLDPLGRGVIHAHLAGTGAGLPGGADVEGRVAGQRHDVIVVAQEEALLVVLRVEQHHHGRRLHDDKPNQDSHGTTRQ